MHGMYGPQDLTHGRETRCGDLYSHLESIGRHAGRVIRLSRSCHESYEEWRGAGIRVVDGPVLLHPGLYSPPQRSTRPVRYVLLAGIRRDKKDPWDPMTLALLGAYRRHGVRVWVHLTNGNQEATLPVWRLTYGIKTDREWSNMLTGAALVICPYSTNIQCVSGILAESISVGVPVLATDFAFAREMRGLYPAHVYVEPKLEEWPLVTDKLLGLPLTIPPFPTWDQFAGRVAAELA